MARSYDRRLVTRRPCVRFGMIDAVRKPSAVQPAVRRVEASVPWGPTLAGL